MLHRALNGAFDSKIEVDFSGGVRSGVNGTPSLFINGQRYDGARDVDSLVEALSRATDLPLDAHLMIDDADTQAPAYAEAGASSVTFHLEAARAPVKLARDLRRKNVQAGVALRPATAVEPLLDIIGEFDMLLLMTVEPGFGGQSFLETMLPKIRRARKAISESNLEVSIQVDGGVSRESIERCAEAGANVFYDISFSASDTVEANNQALVLAIEHARNKAQVMAEAAGMKLGEVLSISEADYSYAENGALYAKAESATDAAGTQVYASPLKVSATVIVEFAMAQAD